MHFCVVGVDRNLIMTVEHSLALQSTGKLYKSSLETTVDIPMCAYLLSLFSQIKPNYNGTEEIQ